MDVQPVITWAAPIASTIITTYVAAMISRGEKKRDEARYEADARRAKEAEWRNNVELRMESQDERIDAILEAQVTQMRSDALHKIHRYIDDMHCASTEEKQALYKEYEVYSDICTKYGIENHFVDALMQQVMELPDRPKPET